MNSVKSIHRFHNNETENVNMNSLKVQQAKKQNPFSASVAATHFANHHRYRHISLTGDLTAGGADRLMCLTSGHSLHTY